MSEPEVKRYNWEYLQPADKPVIDELSCFEVIYAEPAGIHSAAVVAIEHGRSARSVALVVDG